MDELEDDLLAGDMQDELLEEDMQEPEPEEVEDGIDEPAGDSEMDELDELEHETQAAIEESIDSLGILFQWDSWEDDCD